MPNKDIAAEIRKALRDAIAAAEARDGSWSGTERYEVRLSFLRAAQSWLLASQPVRIPMVLRHVERSYQYRNCGSFSPMDLHTKGDRAHFLVDTTVSLALAHGVDIPGFDKAPAEAA